MSREELSDDLRFEIWDKWDSIQLIEFRDWAHQTSNIDFGSNFHRSCNHFPFRSTHTDNLLPRPLIIFSSKFFFIIISTVERLIVHGFRYLCEFMHSYIIKEEAEKKIFERRNKNPRECFPILETCSWFLLKRQKKNNPTNWKMKEKYVSYWEQPTDLTYWLTWIRNFDRFSCCCFLSFNRRRERNESNRYDVM